MTKASEGREGKQDPGYWAGRTNLMYYQYVDFLVRALAADSRSLIDVGSADAQYIESFDWIQKKHTLDIKRPYGSDTVESIEINFFDFEPEEKYDFATCLQVLEHIPDAEAFAQKLFQTARRVLISVPYLWEEGSTSSHVHDPVDLDKLHGWTGREPDYYTIVEEPLVNHHKRRRLIAYYHPEDEKLDANKARRNVSEFPVKQTSASSTVSMPPAESSQEWRQLHGKLGSIESQISQLRQDLESERAHNRKLSRRNERLREKLKKSEAAYTEVLRNRNLLERSHTAIKQSRSWRYTLPIRKVAARVKSLARR